MKKLVYIPLILFFASCVEEIKHSDVTIPDYSEVDFTNFESASIGFRVSDAYGNAISGIKITGYDQSPLEGGKVIFKQLTDKNGAFNTEINLSNTVESMVFAIDYIGLPNYIKVNRTELNNIIIAGSVTNYEQLDIQPGQSQPTESSSRTIQSGNQRLAAVVPPYDYMGSYNSLGVPNYLEPVNDVINAELLSFINASLPEGKPVPTYHPAYLAESAGTNLVVTQEADVWMTFVHEGAGYKNVTGFYTYPTDNPPASVTEIDSITIIYPNTSLLNSGGGLISGNKVHLGKFQPNTTIGFVLFANGWNGTTSGTGIHQVYSNDEFNPESTAANRQHTVLLWDSANELFLIGFEDLNRDGSSDNDFNDAVFYLTANPITAISTNNVAPIDTPVDADGDGVNDVYDEFPLDNRYAYDYVYPSETTFGSFAFEDQWPNVGDYDFNDLVVDYQYHQIANATNRLVKIDAEYVVQAVGAGFKNGFGIQLNLLPSNIASVTGSRFKHNLFNIQSNGTEANQSKAVIIVTDDVHSGFDGYGFINTDAGLPTQDPDTIMIQINLNGNFAMTAAGNAPFNPFLVINQTRGREVHIPGYAPTDLADASYFGNGNDNTQPSKNIYYRSKEGLPWGMNLPEPFAYPLEKDDIRNAHNYFEPWANSQGFSYMDWYMNKSGYRNNNHIYHK